MSYCIDETDEEEKSKLKETGKLRNIRNYHDAYLTNIVTSQLFDLLR